MVFSSLCEKLFSRHCMDKRWLSSFYMQTIQSSVSTWEGGVGICNENLPQGWGISHLIKSNPLICTTFAREGGEWGIQLISA